MLENQKTNIGFHKRITKIKKILECQFENHENHKNRMIALENHENQENM